MYPQKDYISLYITLFDTQNLYKKESKSNRDFLMLRIRGPKLARAYFGVVVVYH